MTDAQKKSAVLKSKPVWLNETAKLYTVVTREGDAYLVLTRRGPIAAKAAVPGHVIKSQETPDPMITPDIAEIEQIADASVLTKFHGLKLYRLRMATGETVGDVLVWTKRSVGDAVDFAQKATRGACIGTYIVTNPVILEDGEGLLATA